MLEEILAVEEEHAEDIASLMFVGTNAPDAPGNESPGGPHSGS